MIPLQLLSLIFGLYMVYWSFLSYKKRLYYLNEMIFWVIVWFVFILVSLFPDTVKFILQTFQISRTMDLLMIIAFMLIWFITFKNYTDNRQLRKKLSELVRSEAIKNARKK
jgi:hypothetical protein